MGTHTKAISAGGGISRGAPLEIPEDVAAAFESLDPVGKCGSTIRFTPVMDAMLLKYWNHANKRAVCRKFKECFGMGCDTTMRRRYKELTQ